LQVHYDAASPDQQRNGEVLSMSNPPSIAEVGQVLCCDVLAIAHMPHIMITCIMRTPYINPLVYRYN
jgi:hypothetical protein